ncbi:histidine phosphatase family protein [Halobacillus andaensis]|uniref:histidine phosphatase family protein n=1 Tax=Halobacillus andaensis TaxID=1176239 RepID=UPI003D72FFEF
MVDRMDLYLIRHGETTSNYEKRYIGWRNEPLSEQGRKQVRLLSQMLPGFETVFASDLLRCTQTAEALAGTWQINRALREYDFGDFDGKSYEELKEDEQYRSWIDDLENVTPPGGETFFHFKKEY